MADTEAVEVEETSDDTEHLSPGEHIEALHKEAADLQDQLENAQRALAKEQSVIRLLQQRLVLSESKRVALRVAHGDLAPDQFETHRRAAEQAVQQIIAAAKQ